MIYSAEAFYTATHRDGPAIIQTPEQMDALIDDLLMGDVSNSIATLYIRERPKNPAGFVDHELVLAVNAEDGVGGLSYDGPDEDDTLFSKGTISQHDEVHYFYVGNDREFPRDSLIPLEAVRQAAKQFLASGGEKPTNVEWQPAAYPVQ